MSTFAIAARHLSPRWLLALLLAGSTLAASACTQPPADGPAPSDANQPAQESEAEHAEEAEAPEAMASKGDAAHGEELFVACAACHGMEGQGVQGLGKELIDNAFIAGMSDEEVVEFLKIGRPASHELNTTGVDMPPKGGNPALSDDDLYDIVAFMRALE